MAKKRKPHVITMTTVTVHHVEPGQRIEEVASDLQEAINSCPGVIYTERMVDGKVHKDLRRELEDNGAWPQSD